MPLTGTYVRNLDDKHRLAIPKSLREEMGNGERVYLAPGTETSLVLYSETEFEAVASRFAAASSHRPDTRNYLRLFYSRAERLDVDKQGRVRIPERLVQFASLEREVVLLGVHDHAEIWDQSRWQHFLEQNAAEFDRLATDAI